MNNTIFLIVGKSGTGKTSIVNELEAKYGYRPLSSYTTRPMRAPDEVGHTFVTDTGFDHLTNLCAFTEYNGYRYCATSAQVDEADLYVIDPVGVEYFKSNYTGNKNICTIYLQAGLSERYDRMKGRGDSVEAIADRIMNDGMVFRDFTDYTYIVHNKDFHAAVTKIYNIIKKHEVCE